MKRLLFILIIFNLQATAQSSGDGLEFIENHGQIVDMEGNLRPDILFVADGGGAKIYLRKGVVSYVMDNGQLIIDNEEEENELGTLNMELGTLQIHRVDMEFVNANMDAKVYVEEPKTEKRVSERILSKAQRGID